MPETVYADEQRKVVIKQIELPETGNDQVRVAAEYSYISAGTELTAIQLGKVNQVQKVESRPLGYSMCGRVLEVGANVDHVKPGDIVACVGEGAFHATEVLVARNLVVPVPPGCSLRLAAMAAMGCFALEGVRKANVAFGENVLIVGGGPMGQFAAQYVKHVSGMVLLIEKNRQRLENLGQGVIGLYADGNVWQRIADLAAPVGIEKAIFCLGGDVTHILDRVKGVMTKSPDGIAQGDIVFCGGATVTVTLASSSGNLRILSSAKAGPGYRDPSYESGADYPSGYVKWTVTRNVATVLKALALGKLDLAHLVTHEYPYTDALEAYQKLAEPDTDALGVLLTYK